MEEWMRASYKEQGFNRKAAPLPGHPPQCGQLQPWSTLASYRQLHFLTSVVGWPESLPTTVHTLMAVPSGIFQSSVLLCCVAFHWLPLLSLWSGCSNLEGMLQIRGIHALAFMHVCALAH